MGDFVYYYGFRPYVSVAKRRQQAQRKVRSLRKERKDVTPVQVTGRTIAKTFWGKAWCDHIESFSDYENRLPRGRSYLRHGSVCHLAMTKGRVDALVLGSRLYEVSVTVRVLQQKKWDEIKATCSGHIGSLLDLLQGKLSNTIMRKMCDRQSGLFPLDKEMTLECSCPDWAHMCKHVAAVLYGVGARLDEDPQALFLLRAVDHEELLYLPTDAIDKTLDQDTQRQTVDSASLSQIFGIDIDLGQKDTTAASHNKKQQNKKHPPLYYTGARLRKIRHALGWIQKEFASELQISVATLSKLENRGPRRKLVLRAEVQEVVHRLWRKSQRKKEQTG
ncbi:MAG: helix-turn-helix domain-containing protein [Myxococcota bacterium]